ncbi:MAG TPA: site-specific integrase [Sedimentisphaerales bacterium]|nr:site-specific integrase [Sedimentisphaerales bacterium]
MRVFKPSYTIPLPQGAKILRRKNGNVAKFTTARGQEIIAPLSKSGKRVSLETNCFHLEFRDHNNFARRLKAFTDEGASQRVAATIEDLLAAKGSSQGIGTDLRRRIEGLPKIMRVELAAWGLLDERASAASKPLTELVGLYRRYMEAKELAVLHVRKSVRDVEVVCSECGFRHLSDIDPDKLNTYLQRRRDRGISYRRSNAILGAVKAFCNWCVDDQELLMRSPIRGKKCAPLDEDKDRRRIRRALEISDLRRLFDVAESSTDVVFGLTGPERALLYRLAAETGIRRGELMQLTVGDFDLVGLTITVPAKVAKSGKERVVPLSPNMAAKLRQRFASKLPTAKALNVPDRTAEMIRVDLETAGLPYKDDRGHCFDFHSLRHECSTLLIESGVDPKVAQAILGHADIRLTLQLYAKTLNEKAKRQQAAAGVSDLIEMAG